MRFGRVSQSARIMRRPSMPTHASTADLAAEMRDLARDGSTFFLSSMKTSTRILRMMDLVSASS